MFKRNPMMLTAIAQADSWMKMPLPLDMSNELSEARTLLEA
jgi:hypothetical protein